MGGRVDRFDSWQSLPWWGVGAGSPPRGCSPRGGGIGGDQVVSRKKASLGGGSRRVVRLEDAALVGAVSVGTRWSLGKNLPGWGVGPGGSVQGSSP